MPVQRRRAGGLHRVLGTAALFSTAYGNVGSSIYYALGLVSIYALGLTPVAFAISGVIFFFTAVTYAEATARFPEAGGSSSFTRHAFNEGVSFFAGWAQMLNYTVTIAISAIFVPHYLAIFGGGDTFRTHPWDIVGGAVVVLLLVCLNIVGVKEAAGLNIFLALADLGTQALLVLIGLFTVFSPHVLQANVHLGVTPTWKNFIVSIPVAMVAYTGIETISNMAEEAIDPPRHVPRSIMYVVLAVFAIYAFLPSVAMSAMPVAPANAVQVRDVQRYQCPKGVTLGEHTTDLACKYAGDPVAGVVQHLGLPHIVTSGLGYYVAILAGTILIIATNAGIIGVSRLTYSMGQHRQLPEVIRRVHPRFHTPWVAIVLYSVLAVGLMIPPGAINFLGNLYAFGAMLSFTLAHASVVQMRRTMPVHDLPWRGPTSFMWGEFDVPLFAIIGGLSTFAFWLVTTWLHFSDGVAPVGVAWLVIGMAVYWIYRRSQGLPLTETVLAAQATHGPAIEVEYRSILLPISSDHVDDVMTATALQLASESGTSVVVMYPIEVPLSESMAAPMESETDEAERQLREAAALGREYGVNVITRIVRTRNIGQAIVEEAERRRSEIIVLGARDRNKPGQRLFGRRVDYVLRNAHCRVMVGADPVGAAPVGN
ncbi:MAG: basic amino acid/polyamine antiporter, family [Gaiellales bacterium]|jgi:APA family basic amino acid/polyamine antiporter|nr:basic amino acid/polyamine antiporter, family [Gaiellales bacterium]